MPSPGFDGLSFDRAASDVLGAPSFDLAESFDRACSAAAPSLDRAGSLAFAASSLDLAASDVFDAPPLPSVAPPICAAAVPGASPRAAADAGPVSVGRARVAGAVPPPVRATGTAPASDPDVR